MQIIRQTIRKQVQGLVGSGRRAAPRATPHDGGLFGPGSAAWTVHGDFTSMMIGGVGSLLTQMLHPAALAGVWDHSNFRKDMVGRLKRTAQFVSVTTYGSTDEALALIARVRRVHDRVQGVLPDGTPYSANDPALLTWVHVAETSAFLQSHLRYRDPAFAPQAQDRYFAEMAVVAEKLGALSVPKTRAEAEAYLQAIRPELRCDRRTREVAHLLLSQRSPTMALAPFNALVMEAGVDLLPRWAADLHGFRREPRRTPALRAGVEGVGRVMRWAMRPDAARA